MNIWSRDITLSGPIRFYLLMLRLLSPVSSPTLVTLFELFLRQRVSLVNIFGRPALLPSFLKIFSSCSPIFSFFHFFISPTSRPRTPQFFEGPKPSPLVPSPGLPSTTPSTSLSPLNISYSQPIIFSSVLATYSDPRRPGPSIYHTHAASIY